MLTIWIRSQSGSYNLYYHKRDRLQAIANARSAVYATVALAQNPVTIDTTAPTFDDTIPEEGEIILWEDDINRYGNGEAVTHNTPFTQSIEALGYKGKDSINLRAELGSSYTPKATSIILCRKAKVEITGQHTGDLETYSKSTHKKSMALIL